MEKQQDLGGFGTNQNIQEIKARILTKHRTRNAGFQFTGHDMLGNWRTVLDSSTMEPNPLA